MGFLDPKALGGSFAVQTARPLEWLFVLGALLILVAGTMFLAHRGAEAGRDRRGMRRLIARVNAGAGELTAVPGWASAAVLTGTWALAVAFIGFVWDVGWHADTGRDLELFTVPHVMILVGLTGIVASGLVAILLATEADVATGWRLRRWRIPFSAVPVLTIGMGALLGFPLDDAWHAAYGIDVTMWSPTHLLMIGGASMSPIAFWLMLSEAGAPASRRGRVMWASMAGVVMIGLSTFQLEFDMGIPQWQAFYHPLLIAGAAAIGLVAARAALGRWGALYAVGFFIALRVVMALLVGGLLGRSTPHFPLYIASALCVEAAFHLLRNRPITWRAGVAGLLVATVGLGAEALWVGATFLHAWQASVLPFAWMFLAIGLLGAMIGATMGEVLASKGTTLRAPVVAACLVGVFVLLGLNLWSRHGDPATVTMTSVTRGTPQLLVNREGVPTVSRNITLSLVLEPDTAQGADWFEIQAWQGGVPVKHFPLVRTSPGHYTASGLIPTGGNWKSLVFLYRGNVAAAAPVSFPADPVYRLKAIDAPDVPRTEALPMSARYLMRESSGTVAWPAIVITGLFGFTVLAWVVSSALAYRAVARAARPPRGPADRRPAGLRTAGQPG